MRLGLIDYLLVLGYFVLVLLVGLYVRRRTKTSTDFFLAGRSIPAWAAALAFISANTGATEVIGIAASGAKYGMLTSHFYWSAIPAMVFLGVFMMPFYYGSRVRSVPEYLRMRFDEKTRALNAISFAVLTVLVSGIAMYASAKLLGSMLGWGFNTCLLVSATIVLVYIVMGGLTSAIYNEVLQFILIVIGFTPLVFIAFRDVGWWSGLMSRLQQVSPAPGSSATYSPEIWTSMWAPLRSASANPMGVEWFGMLMGLGFVLAFGYWCTDFLVVQRAMAAKSMTASRQTPIFATVPKVLFPALVVLPGMIAIALTHSADGGFQLPLKNGGYDYDMVIPALLVHYYPQGLLGLGLVALLASFMSGMAGNITAFNTVWTYDIYQSYIAPDKSDRHYLRVGRLATVVGIGLSIGAAYITTLFNNLMDLVQLAFGFVNAPLFATFLLGMFWRRATGHGAFWGLVCGMLAALLHHSLTVSAGATTWLKGGWFGHYHIYGSEMALNFWTAIYSWTTCFVTTIVVSLLTRQQKLPEQLVGLVYSMTPRVLEETSCRWYRKPATLGIIILAITLGLNIIFW